MPAPVKIPTMPSPMPPDAAGQVAAAVTSSSTRATAATAAASVPLGFAAGCVTVLFFVSLAGVLTPLLLSETHNSPRLFFMSDAFAAGVLSSAAFVHLLPSATVRLSHFAYPWAGLLALGGAATVHVVDVLTAGAHPKVGSRQPVRASLALAAALSVHAFLEGLALGASTLRSQSFGAILIAIALHKAFAALSLGAALSSSGTEWWWATTLAFVFAGSTPIGALGGLALVHTALSPVEAKTASAALTAVSAGVFAYVAFAELLPITNSHEPAPETGAAADEFTSLRSNGIANGNANGGTNGTGALLYGAVASPHGGTKPIVEAWDEIARAVVFVAAAAAMSVLAIWV